MSHFQRATLFVPANRPDRYAKALATAADLVCIDLEDGTADSAKESARDSLVRFLSTGNYAGERLSVRINDPTSELGEQDIQAINATGKALALMLIPKTEELSTIETMTKRCPSVRSLMVLIETAKGLSNVFELAAHDNVSAVGFGSADWSTQIGCAMEWDPLLYPRSIIVHAAVQGGARPIDGAWLDLDDEDGFVSDCHRLRALGFKGRIALHPKQVGSIEYIFSPADDEIERAKQIIAAAARYKDGAFQLDGLIIDDR